MTHVTPLSLLHWLARWLAALCFLLLPTPARAGLADVRVTEIQFAPAGGAGSESWVELMNAGAEPVDLSSAWIGADNSDQAKPLAGLAPVPPGGFVVIHWNTETTGAPTRGPVPDSASQEFSTGPITPLSGSHGSLILSHSRDLLEPAAMLAFIQWGAPDQKGSGVADALGLWPHDQALPAVAPGHTLALAPGGSPRFATGWFDAAVPTPGAVNTGPVSAWRGWKLVGTSVLAPAATWDMAGDLLDVIGISALGQPVHYHHHDGVWAPGVPIEATTPVTPGLAGSGGGNLDLVLVDPDGQLWHRRFRDGRWGAPLLLGPAAPLPPALAYNTAARELELVVADPTGALQFTRAAGGPWSPWSPVGAIAGPVPPALAINLLDRPFDLLFVGPDGMLDSARFAAGSWRPPLGAGSYATLSPAVAVTGAGTVQVVVTAPDHRVYYNELTDGIWGVWQWTGLESASAPALLSSPTEYGLELIVADRDGRLLHSRFVNNVWGRPWSLGAVTGQPTAITAGPDGGLELLMAGADGNLWHNRFRPTSPDLISLTTQVQQIFDAHCVECHDSGDPIEGQNLEPDSAYFNIVNVRSSEAPRLPRVDPGNPDGSYLIHKVSGTQASVGGSGDRMPLGGQLTDEEIRTLRQWIAQGALNN